MQIRIKASESSTNPYLQGKSRHWPKTHTERLCKIPLKKMTGWIVFSLHYIFFPTNWTHFPHILVSFLILFWFCLPDVMVTDGMNQPCCLDYISLILANFHNQFYGAGWEAFFFFSPCIIFASINYFPTVIAVVVLSELLLEQYLRNQSHASGNFNFVLHSSLVQNCKA